MKKCQPVDLWCDGTKGMVVDVLLNPMRGKGRYLYAAYRRREGNYFC